MHIGLNWRNTIEGAGPLGVAVAKELDSLIAGISAWSNVEHNDDGTHADVTADSVVITGSPVTTALNVITGLASLAGAVAFPGVITPDQITSNQNDYAPLGWDSAFCLRLSTDATRDLTGIVAPNPAAGRLLFIVNVGSNDITLLHENASSTAENRFLFSGASDVTLTTLSTLLLYYDSIAERWIALGGSGSGGGVTPHDLLSVTHPDTTPAAPQQGDVIIATRTLGNVVDSSKFWANGQPYGALSTTNDAGTLAYWQDGNSGLWLPTPTNAGALTWQRKSIGNVGDVLTTVLENGQRVPDWRSPSSSGSSTGARAYRSTNMSLVFDVVTPIPLSATEFDTGGYWTSLNPTGFTAPATGLYMVVGQGTYTTAFGLVYEYIYVNGTQKAAHQSGLENVDPSYGDYDPGQVSAILYLNAGDFVEFRIRAVRLSGANTTLLCDNANRTWFSILKVG
jgi:hypothetical protein